MSIVFHSDTSWSIFSFIYIYLSACYIGFGGMMVYKLVLTFILCNLIYEIVEIVFPVNKMKNIVKSFVLIVLLYAISKYIISIL